MKVKRVLQIVIILLLFYNCNSNKTKNIYPTSIIRLDSVCYIVPDTIPVIEMGNWDYCEGIFAYTVVKKDHTDLISLNLITSEWNVIPLPKDLTNGVISFVDNKIIIYLDKYKKKISKFSLIDRKTECIEELSFDRVFATSNSGNFNLQYSEDRLLIPTLPEMRLNEDFFKSEILTIFDLKNQIKKDVLNYPKEFLTHHNINVSNSIADFVFVGDTVIYSFKKDKNLYYFNVSSENSFSFIVEDKNISNDKIDEEDKMKHAIISAFKGQYLHLIYDKYRDVFYRISSHYVGYNNEFPKDKLSLNKLLKSREIQVSVIDRKFNVIAKNVFSEVTESSFFITKEGLFLRSMHETNENEMKFVKFILH